MSVLSNLKKFMRVNGVSVIDLDWGKLKEYRISMPKLLRWELREDKKLSERKMKREAMGAGSMNVPVRPV